VVKYILLLNPALKKSGFLFQKTMVGKLLISKHTGPAMRPKLMIYLTRIGFRDTADEKGKP